MGSQPTAGSSKPPFDLHWDTLYDLSNHSVDGSPDGCFRFSLHYVGAARDDPSIGALVANLSIDPELPDSRATWHRNYTPLAPWIRVHILKQAMGWNGETQLADHFEKNPKLTVEYGFIDGNLPEKPRQMRPKPPAQSRLWEMWHEEFSDGLRAICHEVASELVELAHEEGIPAPDDVFRPDAKQNASERSETRLIADTTKEVWQHAKPFVTDEFFLKRGDNTQIHENAFWEQHAFMGVRKNMYAESSADSFYVDSTRDNTPSGSCHRWQIRKLSIDEMRRQHRRTTKRLIERARRDGELVGKLWAAIDVSKGTPFTGEMDIDADGDVVEPYILGHRDGSYYYQWASIQIVGHDIPLVLDALPKKRGMSKDEIVDELLAHATDMVDDIDLVMMDREFDSEPVKDTCEEYGVHYLNSTRIFERSDEAETIAWMYRTGKRFHVTEEKTPDGTPTYKQLYLPKRSNSDSDDEDDVPSEVWKEMCGEWDFDEEEGEPSERMAFSRLLADIHREEAVEERKQKAQDGDVDTAETGVFETNHPYVTGREADDQQMDGKAFVHMIERVMRWYRHRWGIENGFKKQKHFMVRTTSIERDYRFFNFAFACVLYNVWRLVDLLVKFAIDDKNRSYAPRVDANQFLTVAKECYGLDPPD